MERVCVRIALVGLVVAAIGIPAGRFEAAKQYTLAYKMNKGATFAVQVARKHRNHRNFMGNDLITNAEGLREYRFTVKSSSDDGLTLELECTKREYKSDDTQALMSPDFSGLIGSKDSTIFPRFPFPARTNAWENRAMSMKSLLSSSGCRRHRSHRVARGPMLCNTMSPSGTQRYRSRSTTRTP
jgi:hypothetical protein